MPNLRPRLYSFAHDICVWAVVHRPRLAERLYKLQKQYLDSGDDVFSWGNSKCDLSGLLSGKAET